VRVPIKMTSTGSCAREDHTIILQGTTNTDAKINKPVTITLMHVPCIH